MGINHFGIFKNHDKDSSLRSRDMPSISLRYPGEPIPHPHDEATGVAHFGTTERVCFGYSHLFAGAVCVFLLIPFSFEYLLLSLVGFKGILSLLDVFVFFFSGG